ncbi:MAG TPA: group II truncated hemoglobin [Rhodocyclaceae bacterium]|nr:group II truncated hemoglobin [Rhodocyclaceae bacterium]
MSTPENTPSVYERIGGEATLRTLVKRFYELMDTLPEAYGIRKMHPEDLSGSGEKLFMYLSGYLGGPNLFIEKFGHPRLRARHMPFSIGADERDQWLMCMNMAMAETVPDELLRKAIMKAITDLADFMRNKEEAQPESADSLPILKQ